MTSHRIAALEALSAALAAIPKAASDQQAVLVVEAELVSRGFVLIKLDTARGAIDELSLAASTIDRLRQRGAGP